jgi:hypothetical protein
MKNATEVPHLQEPLGEIKNEDFQLCSGLLGLVSTIQTYCVKELGYHWTGTASLSTVAAAVKQAEGDKYVTSSLVLSFINTRIKSLPGDGSIKQPWFGKGNARSEFHVSSAHESIKSARKSGEDLELRWVTNLSEERKRFYLIATLLDPRTKMLSFCDNKYFPIILERRGSRISFNGV